MDNALNTFLSDRFNYPIKIGARLRPTMMYQ